MQDPQATMRHGAVFLLSKSPSEDATVIIDGWVTRVSAGTKAVVTTGPSIATDWEQSHSDALRAANYGLDYLCMTGKCNTVIREDVDDCLAWWPEAAGGVNLRARVVITRSFQLKFEGLVRDPAGNVVTPPRPPTPAVHDAFRLIRMALTSRYLFDSYRNMFLALESLLSDIRPQRLRPNGKPDEGERAWFTDAMTAADALVSVSSLAPSGTADPIQWVYENIYSAQRSALMHAKPGRFLLPHDDASRHELRQSLIQLWRYVRELVAQHLGVVRGESSWSSWFWDQWADAMADGSNLVVTDDLAPVISEADSRFITPGSTVVNLQPDFRYSPVSMLRFVRAGIDAEELRVLRSIGRVGLRVNGAAARHGVPAGGMLVISELAGPLVLGPSVSRFELEVGQRHITAMGVPWFAE